jgi:hypothetical protein
MKRIVLALVAVMVLAGCASWFPTVENYEKGLISWVGKPGDDLIRNWGPPRNSYKLSNGETVIEYYESHLITRDYGGFFSHNERIGVETLWCKTIFVIGSNGKVSSWKHDGNDCTAYPEKQ